MGNWKSELVDVTLTFTKEELIKLDKKAADEDASLNSYLKRLILDHIQ